MTTSMEDIALPPEVAARTHTEISEEGERDSVAQEQAQQPVRDVPQVQANPAPQGPVEEAAQQPAQDVPAQAVPNMAGPQPGLSHLAAPKSALDYAAAQYGFTEGPAPYPPLEPLQLRAAPPATQVNVSLPPEVLSMVTDQFASALGDLRSQMLANVEATARAVLDNLPAQEASAAKKNPWLVPALDIAVGVAALAALAYVLVAAITFGNPLAKQYIGAVGMVVLALLSRSPISPPPTPQNVQRAG